MDETNNQDKPTENNENNVNDDIDIEEDDSDTDEDAGVDLDSKVLQRLKQNDPTITHLNVALNCGDDGECFFNDIDWEKDGDCIANNIHLKRITINRKSYRQRYVLGEQGGHELPTRQQLQDFFSCVHQNSSIFALIIDTISINDDFSGRSIQGLGDHPSLKRLEIEFGRLENKGCSAIGEVLNNAKSKLNDLRLPNCRLDDEDMLYLSGSLLGNSRMRKLCLNNNSQITSVGWRALSNVIRHPNCKLTTLSLGWNSITDEGAVILGNALSGASVKALDLCYNKSISFMGWHTLLNQLSETSVEHLSLKYNDVGDVGSTKLASISTLKSLDLQCLNEDMATTPTGWRPFFDLLRTRGIQLVKLDLSYTNMGNGVIVSLGSFLSAVSSTLKTLKMINMSYPYYEYGHYVTFTPQDWQTLFTTYMIPTWTW